MKCSNLDGEVEFREIITYDDAGHVVRRAIEYGAPAAGPMVMDPPGTCEPAVVWEYPCGGVDLPADNNRTDNDARFYDATQGRWLDQSPMGFDAGESNLYRYHNPG